ncbi:MAG: hypothetical protein NT111_03080 [Patescibacteria group bacterium]|nr:hypothetical protein [Patescibacteria group bacterium]
MKRVSFIQIGLSLVFLVIALVVLGDLVGLIKANNIFGQYWPALLILLGVMLIGPNSRNNGISFGIIILGILLLMNTFNLFATQGGKVVLIMLLSFSGLAMLVFATTKKHKGSNPSSTSTDKELYF